MGAQGFQSSLLDGDDGGSFSNETEPGIVNIVKTVVNPFADNMPPTPHPARHPQQPRQPQGVCTRCLHQPLLRNNHRDVFILH